MGILTLHEFGHYFAARYYKVPATLPYFLPAPNFFGTFGAFIKMEGLIPNRKALFDIGIMGPAMGLVLAIPATVIGLYLSKVVDMSTLPVNSTLPLGDSLLFNALAYLIHGKLQAGYDIMLHPLGFAGWVGLFVTALNLIPIGQLDGGHIVYALLKNKSTRLYQVLFMIMVILVIYFKMLQWLVFLLMIFFLVRLKHPPTLNDQEPLGKMRVAFGVLALLFLLLAFPPVLLKLPN